MREHRKMEEQQTTIAQLKSGHAKQQKDIAALTELVKEQAALTRKVSDQVEVSKRRPQLVADAQRWEQTTNNADILGAHASRVLAMVSRHHELCWRSATTADLVFRKACVGAAPKPARKTRALPRFATAAWQLPFRGLRAQAPSA